MLQDLLQNAPNLETLVVTKVSLFNWGILSWSFIATISPAVVIKPFFESQRCCRIFYSLNFQEFPEFFEDHMKEWMTEFRKYLIYNYPVLENSGANGLAIIDELRAAVCENINLYMEKNEEEFQVYLNDFAIVVWSLLGTVTQSSDCVAWMEETHCQLLLMYPNYLYLNQVHWLPIK